MKIKAIALAVMLGSTAITSQLSVAASYPVASGFDKRIQNIDYNPDDVVVIRTYVGNTTLIELQQGEYLVGDPGAMLAIGDEQAWTIGVRKNRISIKPRAEFPDTNINLVTNLRVYSIELVTMKEGQVPSWQVRYRYPSKPVPYSKDKAVAHRTPCSDGPVNRNYFKSGDNELSPAEAWDDGRFTCLRFPTAKTLPNVYRYNPTSDLEEAITNVDMQDDVLVVFETSDEFRLRVGNKVLGLKTDSRVDAPYNWKGTTTGETRVKLNDQQ